MMPYSDPKFTNREQVKIMITTFEFPENGGSQILNYEIEYDDGNNGDFTSTLTLSPSIVVSTGISNKGKPNNLIIRIDSSELTSYWGVF